MIYWFIAQHYSWILLLLPPKYYAGIKLALLRFLCIRRNPLIANNLLNIIGMYYLLIITNCICHKYGARLRQIACFWVILKKNSCAGGRYSALPARTWISPAFSAILLGKYAPRGKNSPRIGCHPHTGGTHYFHYAATQTDPYILKFLTQETLIVLLTRGKDL